MKPIPIELFGRDHWSTFAFIETQCVDGQDGVAVMEMTRIERMRCDPKIHPQFAHRGTRGAPSPTRLNDDQTITGHDDWSCLDDCEAAGLIENIGSGIHRMYKMRPLGTVVAAQIRLHKTQGGSFKTFKLPAPANPDQFEVIVGNIGKVYDGPDRLQAEKVYNEYVSISKSGVSRAAHEPVTLMVNGEPEKEHTPATSEV